MRVAGTVNRFPGTTGDAVIGDVEALETAIDTQVAGRRANERDLARRPFRRATPRSRPPSPGRRSAAVEAVSRRTLVAEAQTTRSATGHAVALDAAALVALLLAALGLVLTVLADLRDDRGDLYDLEAQGAAPSLLRRIVRVRALVVAIAGLIAGAVAGALLALLVTQGRLRDGARATSATAAATVVRPPRRRASACGVYLVVAACPRRARDAALVPGRPRSRRGRRSRTHDPRRGP